MGLRLPTTLPLWSEMAGDMRLQGTFTIAHQEVVIDFGFGRQSLNFTALERLFQERHGITTRFGTFQIEITQEDVRVLDEAEVYTQAQWQDLVGAEAYLGRFFRSYLEALFEGYRGQPTSDHLEEIVCAAVQRVLNVHEQAGDPLKKSIQIPTPDEVAHATFEGACAICAFSDPAAIVSSRRRGGKPPLRSDVVTVHGINVRARIDESQIFIVIGYLNHENPFESAFHAQLVERLQSLLTPELIQETVLEDLVLSEVTRRVVVREQRAILEAFGITDVEVSSAADRKEIEIEESSRRTKESEVPLTTLFRAFGYVVPIMGAFDPDEMDPSQLG